jgi:glyoxylase-like metal-dependent hydrolase (beta-lactamase superfamily II)
MERIAPDLYRLSSGGTAAVHLVAASPLTLVDAGAPGRGPAIERELRSRGVTPARIVLTHGDPDHVGGSDHLRASFGLEVCASIAEQPLLDRSGWPGLPVGRRLLMRAFFRGAGPPHIDRWLGGSEDLGGLGVVPTPGHTPGHLAFEWRGWILAGDAFVSGGRFRESPRIFTLDRGTARRSIEAVRAREPRWASTSHGRPAGRATERLNELIASWS